MTHFAFLPNFNRNIWLILFSTAVIGFAVEGGAYSVLFNIYLLRLDYDAEFIGVVNSLGNFAFALAALGGGLLGQRWGVRRLMLIGMVLATVAIVFIPIAPIWDGVIRSSLFALIVILRNVGNVMVVVGSTPYIMSFAIGQTRTKAFAVDSAFYGIAAFAGAWIGGLLPSWIATTFSMSLTDAEPYRYSFIVVALALFAGVFFLAQTEPAPFPTQTMATGFMRTARTMPIDLQKTVVVFSLISVLGGLGTGVPYVFSNVYFDDQLQMPTSLIGQLQAGASLMAVATVLLLPRWLKRVSLSRATLITYLALGVAVILIGATESWWLTGGGFVMALGLNGLRFAVFRMYSMQPIPEAFQAFTSGLMSAGIGIGFALISVLSGFLVARVGYLVLFTSSGILVLITAAIIWLSGTTLANVSRSAPP